MAKGLVLDCSVTMALLFEDELFEGIDEILKRIASEPLFVPEIWTIEVGNVLLQAQKRQQISQAQVNLFVADLDLLKINVVRLARLDKLSQILPIAHQYNLSFYDAQYLYLCLDMDLALLTFDRTLTAAATKAGVALVTSKSL